MKSLALVVLCVISAAAVFLLIKTGIDGPGRDTITQSNQTLAMNNLELTSPAFASGNDIPAEYTCDGDNTNPPLLISGVPDTAAALVLIMEDPDVPRELRDDEHFVHWVAFNIAPDTTSVPADTSIGTDGKNSTGDIGYVGPCPPTQYEPKTHRYFFRLYAVDGLLDVPEGASQEEVEKAMDGRIVGQAELMGRYSRLQ